MLVDNFVENAFGICHLSVVPLRLEPSDRSEIISELLFGECFEILEKQEKWSKIKCLWDDYEAWIDNKQFVSGLSQNDANSSLRDNVLIDRIAEIESNNFSSYLSIASTINLDVLSKYSPNIKYRLSGRAVEMGTKGINTVPVLAQSWINTPYLWGGRSIFGIDCSGFTQNVFKMHGVRLKRDAYLQADQGTLINFIEEAQPGDLAFFDNDEERIIHVGIVLENQQIIHASGHVRIDRLDHQGIFNIDTKKYSHKLRIIKRMI